MRASEDGAGGGGVAAEEGFGVHHALFGGGVGDARGGVREGGEEPLGEVAVGGGGVFAVEEDGGSGGGGGGDGGRVGGG